MVTDVVKGDLFYGDYAFFHCDLSLFCCMKQPLILYIIPKARDPVKICLVIRKYLWGVCTVNLHV